MMDAKSDLRVPLYFWVVGGVALLWNIMGCGIFFNEMFNQEAAMESFTEAQKEWVRTTPSWVYVIFGLSVATGLAACVGLLLRKNWALPLFVASFLFVLIQMGYTMLVAGGLQVMGPAGAVMPIVVVILALAWVVSTLKFRNADWWSGH
ncbi:MAG: hypothetical protein P8J91_13685 [Pirellulaceae bacterium]|nr:hypothetical protein [Pirellulaceae bacterium]MDG2104796.1 hypothetical protein [Pirellulaceae bacterium]